MKKIKILTATLAVAALGGFNAMAQLNYQTGDLLAGFGNSGSANYVLVDLGSITNFQVASAAYTWDFSSVLSSTVGGVNNNVYWSVFGVNDLINNPNSGIQQGDQNTVWNTARTLGQTVPGDQSFLVTPYNQIITLANVSIGAATDISAGVITAPSGTVDGFNSQMIPGGDFAGTWTYNTTRRGANLLYLMQNDPANSGSPAQNLGSFSLSSGGVLTFNTVPEPSTWAMIGSGALALLAIRRRNK